ncbi:MAG: PDDEXK nuclease domain-containing protein [Candidatus Woesearchaeota archaeon]
MIQKNRLGNKLEVEYDSLVSSIGTILERAKTEVCSQINHILVKSKWDIGRQIVEYEQKGNERAEYGSFLLKKLSGDLKIRYGKGFSQSNIYLMRQFYIKHPKFQTVSGKLSWSHYVELLMIENDFERSFYMQQCIIESWTVREFKRQKRSALFERLALSKDKKEVVRLAKRGQKVREAEDLIKDPYILEFLDIEESHSERELEQKVIDNLQRFILELGKGFSFVARQFRITLGNKHYYVDLVFYHRILRCFVLIDLKIGRVDHGDIGQMNMYLNYFKAEEMSENENEPIGIILSADNDSFLVKYALGGISNKLFVSKYKLYLPDKKILEKRVKEIING